MNFLKGYDTKKVEKKIYQYWINNLKKASFQLIKKEKKKEIDCIKNIFFLKKKKNKIFDF
ncbi:MAG: hypothetical protein ACE19O_00020 [Candidatus Karelsulcia muelleri]